MTFAVKQSVFEGPLDLLLRLIEQSELDITTVSLAKVTDQYLAYVEELERQHLPEVSEFLVIAARLMLLKSRALLPAEPVDEEEVDDLVDQLAEYKLIKELSGLLDDGLSGSMASYSRPAWPFEPPEQVMTDGVSADGLEQAWRAVIARLPVESTTATKQLEEHVTIEQCIERVTTALHTGPTAFEKLFTGLKTRLAMIVTFLAVLELFKQRTLRISNDLMVSLRA